MKKYKTPPNFPQSNNQAIDLYGGFLSMTAHWRPDPNANNPEMPGHKLTMTSYIPLSPRDTCLCGSGKEYAICCRPKKLWHPVCPNPDGQGYAWLKPQSATYRKINGDMLRQRLNSEPRLRCLDKSLVSAFWIFQGDPSIEDEYGTLCFGDFELKRDRTLLVTAMSNLRMQILLDLLEEIAGDLLKTPRKRRDKVQVIDKKTQKMRKV